MGDWQADKTDTFVDADRTHAYGLPVRGRRQGASVTDFEKLGLFYLGRELDPGNQVPQRHSPSLRLVRSRHARRDRRHDRQRQDRPGHRPDRRGAIDGVPVIAIDPKGDLGNLLLTFPKLAAADFAPWVNADEARRAGQTAEAFAAAEASTMVEGPRRVGPGRHAHRAVAGCGGVRALHAGQLRRAGRCRS